MTRTTTTTTKPRTLLLASAALLLSSALTTGCVVYDDGAPPRDRGTTTTTTTVEDRGPIVPSFAPRMGSVTAETLEYDAYWETSWQLYTMNFTDVADTYACGVEMPSVSQGSVASIELHGFEIEDEYAACPTGTYRIVPDCTLGEGEACMELVWRDERGRAAGTEWARGGTITVSLEPAYTLSDPHRCVISTWVDGHPDMSFDYELYFDSYELAPTSAYAEICMY